MTCFNTNSSQNRHWKYLEDELKAQTETFERKFYSRASYLMFDKKEMYLGKFMGFRGGEMLILFPNTRSIPRRGEALECMLLPEELRQYKNWGDITYEGLYERRFKSSEASCIWQSTADDPRCTMVGFGEIDIEFETFLQDQDNPNVFLVFAPQRPPIEYLVNLQHIVSEPASGDISQILDLDKERVPWVPKLISGDKPDDEVYQLMKKEDVVILQGPPGTGKTYLIAQLCARFAEEGKSIMVTALTNRALMEVSEKEPLEKFLAAGKVRKTSLKSSELQENPQLRELEDIDPDKGIVTLATYFKSSGYAVSMTEFGKFDVVIMDEASQAFTATFAAVRKMAGKTLWVGDTKQMPPISMINADIIKERCYIPMIQGMQFVADHLSKTVYQLSFTRRFGERAAQCTGTFYNDTLSTMLKEQTLIIPDSLNGIVNQKGGPVVLEMPLAIGEKAPIIAIDKVMDIVRSFVQTDKSKEIAVLSLEISTVKDLQSALTRNNLISKKVFADTVARVQGLTTDVIIYVVPNSSYMFSLEPRLFNVATSRAREHTIIIANSNIFSEAKDPSVKRFLEIAKN